MCACCQIEPKTQNMYSTHFSLVERPHHIRGAQVQSQANTLYLDLGSLHHKMKIKISGAFRKIKSR